MNELTLIQTIIIWAVPVIFAITVHEVAHGWVAKQYGDNTAFNLGRLTLNPISHIDLIGTIVVPGLLLLTGAGFIFGWAKPVPVDPRNFKNPKKDMAIVALAGPVSNLLMALGWALLIRIGLAIESESISPLLMYMGFAGISINLVLALLNLLPIPPLDGSRILTGILPHYWAWQYNRFEQYGFILLLALLWMGGLSYLLGYPMSLIRPLYLSVAGLQ